METQVLYWLIIIICICSIILKNGILKFLDKSISLRINKSTFIKSVICIGLALLFYVGCKDSQTNKDKGEKYTYNSPEQNPSSSTSDTPSSASSEYMTDEEAIKAREEYETKKQKEYEAIFERIISFKNITFCKNMSDLKQFIQIIEETNNAIAMSEQSEQKEKAKKALSTFQIHNFPLARKLYYENAKNELWEKDIDVKLSGKDITFIGYQFSTNSVIKDTYLEISDELTKLRFKAVGFKAFDGDNKTYWKLDTKNDSEI